jgi:hypothetical protein
MECADAFIQLNQFKSGFAADMPSAKVEIVAVSRHPLALAAFLMSGFRSKRHGGLSRHVLGDLSRQRDRSGVGANAARRRGSTAVEVDASHAVAVSRRDAVGDIILGAVKSVS